MRKLNDQWEFEVLGVQEKIEWDYEQRREIADETKIAVRINDEIGGEE